MNGISLNNLNSSNRKMFENLVFTKKYNFMGHALRGNFMNILNVFLVVSRSRKTSTKRIKKIEKVFINGLIEGYGEA